MLTSSVSSISSPRSFSILYLMRRRNYGTPMTTKSRVGFSSCREFPKQSREKSLKRYKCLAFEPAEFLHESWKKSSSAIAESSQTLLQSMITELELKLSFSISLSLWESKFGTWSISVLLLQIAKTYGKVFHFWQFDKGDTLPIGPPQLMMAITADGRLKLAAGECVPPAPHPLFDLLLLLNS